MNKDLIDLCRNTNALCAIIIKNESDKLQSNKAIKINLHNEECLLFDEPMALYKIKQKSTKNDYIYLILDNLDLASVNLQEKLLHLVKDREICGQYLPSNCIIVFTVNNKRKLVDVIPELYNLSFTII